MLVVAWKYATPTSVRFVLGNSIQPCFAQWLETNTTASLSKSNKKEQLKNALFYFSHPVSLILDHFRPVLFSLCKPDPETFTQRNIKILSHFEFDGSKISLKCCYICNKGFQKSKEMMKSLCAKDKYWLSPGSTTLKPGIIWQGSRCVGSETLPEITVCEHSLLCDPQMEVKLQIYQEDANVMWTW